MPQMAPMWWTSIMLTTIILMLIMMTIVYFNFNKKIKTKFTSKEIIKYNWMW